MFFRLSCKQNIASDNSRPHTTSLDHIKLLRMLSDIPKLHHKSVRSYVWFMKMFNEAIAAVAGVLMQSSLVFCRAVLQALVKSMCK